MGLGVLKLEVISFRRIVIKSWINPWSLWVVFRKINKMMCSGDKEWTEKLQPAVLAANTQTKRSTGYTPFYLMFGREFDSSKLLNIVTSPTNPSLNSKPIIESDT